MSRKFYVAGSPGIPRSTVYISNHTAVEDILEAIAKIQRYTKDMTLAEFEADELKVDAVVGNFTIIGEAARKILPKVENSHADIPWGEIRGLRNRVVHKYRNVDLEIVWDIIQNYLPPLVTELCPLLEEPDGCE